MPEHERSSDRTPVDMSQIPAVSVRRLSDEVAARIRLFIVEQNLQEGTRLPSERALADIIGTSRPTVSQALRTLSLMGLVEVRRGAGAFVLRRPDRTISLSVNLMLELDHDKVDHLVALRLWLETIGVREAVENGTDDDIRTAREALDRLRRSVGSTSTWIAADTIFHATIVGLSGNPFLTSIYEGVHTTLMGHEFQPWVENNAVPAWLEPSQAEPQMAIHAPIVEAIERRDAEAAAEAVRRHNDAMREHLEDRGR